jgi:alkylated DNA repair protein alkB family protein 8
VPEMSGNITEFEEIQDLPDGLVYIEDFIGNDYAKEICDFIMSDASKDETNLKELKHRKVKHYGYEFRYGTNDCDEAKQLTEESNRMPQVMNKLIDKMLHNNLIPTRPDQLTVNIYEPGQGIPPHLDNPLAFDDFIISLSLLSSVVMDLKHKEAKKLCKLHLKPNSLLIFKQESRYKWTHGIADRKYDLYKKEDNSIRVDKRAKRISLTFRKVKTDNSKPKVESENLNEPEMKLPTSEMEALNFERSYVHTVYNKIADHFSSTRHSAWPGVAKFIHAMHPYSSMLDVGCGNGKYLNLRNDLYAVRFLIFNRIKSIQCQNNGSKRQNASVFSLIGPFKRRY